MSTFRAITRVISADSLSTLQYILHSEYNFTCSFSGFVDYVGYARTLEPIPSEIDTDNEGFNINGFLKDSRIGESDFDTDLYQELLNNEETVSNLNTYINGGDVSMITDKDLAFQKNIELYNANVLSLRATKKVSVSGSISQSGQQSDLSGVENKLQNINNNLTNLNSKLEIEKTVDDNVEIKSITEIIDEKSSDSPIVVSSEDLSPWSAV